MLRALYDRTLQLSAHRHASWGLAFVAFVESSVFPIPPDIMLIPMVLANRAKVWILAAICTLASAAGALVGYLIGYALWESVGQPIIAFYNGTAAFDRFVDFYDIWGIWIVLAAAISFLPFKVATIASGVAGLALGPFFLACLVGRGIRFFGVAGLLYYFGTHGRRLNPLNLLSTLSLQKRIALCFVLAFGIIASALASELIGGLVPCDLCLKQRIAYYLALVLLGVAYFYAPHAPLATRGLLHTVGIIFLGNAGLGIYHAGIEYGLWLGPATCGATHAISASPEALMEALKSQSIVSCDAPAWTLFGISLAGYNAMASGALAICALSNRSTT